MDNVSETDYFEETPAQAAQRIISEAAPFAAASIASLAQDDTVSPTVRLNAAKYLVDRNLGPIGQADKQDALEEFLMDLQNEANGGSRG